MVKILTLTFLSNKVSGAVNHGQVHHLEMPTFQRAIKFCVVNPEVIFVVLVQISMTLKKKPLPMLSPRVVVRLPIIRSQEYPTRTAGHLSMEIGVSTFECTALGWQYQTIVKIAPLGNIRTS
jgi:hypothetical protein